MQFCCGFITSPSRYSTFWDSDWIVTQSSLLNHFSLLNEFEKILKPAKKPSKKHASPHIFNNNFPQKPATRHINSKLLPRKPPYPSLFLKCLASAEPIFISMSSVTRLHHECTTSAPRVHHDCTTMAPRLHHECTMSPPRAHHESTMSSPGAL